VLLLSIPWWGTGKSAIFRVSRDDDAVGVIVCRARFEAAEARDELGSAGGLPPGNDRATVNPETGVMARIQHLVETVSVWAVLAP